MSYSWLYPVLMAYMARESSQEQDAMRKAANQPKEGTSTRTPYFNDTIVKLLPYLVAQQQKVYESRQKTYGFGQTNAGYGNIQDLMQRLLGGSGGGGSNGPAGGTIQSQIQAQMMGSGGKYYGPGSNQTLGVRDPGYMLYNTQSAAGGPRRQGRRIARLY